MNVKDGLAASITQVYAKVKILSVPGKVALVKRGAIHGAEKGSR
jgi:hypothetical protein